MRVILLLRIVIGISLLIVLAGCGARPGDSVGDNVGAPVVRVAVHADGQLFVGGTSSSLDSLRERLKRLHSERGSVWYYREQGHESPPLIALQVMKAVVEAGVPVKLSMRPDYSDGVGLTPPR